MLLLLLLLVSLIFIRTAFDNRTASAREIWRQMQATRYHKANPKLKINTVVSGSAAAPEVVFKFIDDTEVNIIDVLNRNIKYIYDGTCYWRRWWLPMLIRNEKSCHSHYCRMMVLNFYFWIYRNDSIVVTIQQMKFSSTSTCPLTTLITNLKWAGNPLTIKLILLK